MLGFCFLAPLGDGIAKILGDTIPLALVLLVRFAIQTGLLLPFALISGKPLPLSGRLLQLTFLRTLLQILGIGAMFLSLRYLPLADAIAIAFIMPFLMLLLGRFVLGEQVGPHRITACLIGFIGTLLVIQPNYDAVGAPALLPLLVAVVFALYMLVTRGVAKVADPIGLQAVSGAMAAILLAIALLFTRDSEVATLQLMLPDTREAVLLLGLGILGTLAHLMMTWSLRLAPAATLAPMQYLEIPFATLIGWAIFRDLPNGTAAFGIALTIAAGLYVIHREQAAARGMVPET